MFCRGIVKYFFRHRFHILFELIEIPIDTFRTGDGEYVLKCSSCHLIFRLVVLGTVPGSPEVGGEKIHVDENVLATVQKSHFRCSHHHIPENTLLYRLLLSLYAILIFPHNSGGCTDGDDPGVSGRLPQEVLVHGGVPGGLVEGDVGDVLVAAAAQLPVSRRQEL